MLTNTHILIATAALTRTHFTKRQNLLVIFGGLFPDLSIAVLAMVGRMPGSGVTNLWRKPDGLYWQEPWQFLSALSNSIPLYALALLVFWVLLRRRDSYKGLWLCLGLFSAACLSHVLVDLLVHADDAHVHFWPLSGERFHSPVSYWQRQYYGDWVSSFEILLGLGLGIILWRRFKKLLPRLGVVLLLLPYLLSLAFLARGFMS